MKTFAFIDSQNLNLGVRSLGWKLDFARFRKYLTDKYKVERAFLFIGFIEDNQLLYTNLQEAGFICVFKPTLRTSSHESTHDLTVGVSSPCRTASDSGKPTTLQSGFYRDKKIKIKGNVDAELVLHTMIEYPHYDKAIIISGDGDFHCLIEYLDQKNKLLKVIVPNKYYSSLLKKFRQYIVHVADFKNKVEKTKKERE